MAIQARKAVRQKVKVKAALIGPSGSGKTYSALRMAKGIGGKVLLVNTEGDRGYLYADEFDYDIVDLAPPFTPEKYIEAVDYGEKEGYDIIIIDSGSHEWSGRGGLLEIHDSLPGNSYTNWGKVNPRHNAFVDRQLYSRCHIINCLRGKDQYALEDDEKGKKVPKKLGMGPEQRANYEYEMMVTFMIDQQTHVASVTKDNTHLFEGKYEVLTEEHGKQLLRWANSGIALEPRQAPFDPPGNSAGQGKNPPPTTPSSGSDAVKTSANAIMEFGKHKGKTLGAIFKEHPDYVIWFLEKGTDPGTKTAFQILQRAVEEAKQAAQSA